MYIIPGVMGGGGEMQRCTTRGDGKTQKERLGQRKREIHIHTTRGDGRKRQKEMYVLYLEKEREGVCMYSIPGVMEAPAAIYILSAISTSDMFSTSSVKACTSSNDIPSCTMMVEICTHTIEYANLYQYVNVLKQHCE